MKHLKRTRYWTMNSWNESKSLAYNLKVYNVVDEELQNKVYDLMDTENFYDEINFMIGDFDFSYNYEWQAGFNGRSGGYLVLYKGGRNENGTFYCQPGLNITEDEVPSQVKKDFRNLAVNIVKYAERAAKTHNVVEEDIQVVKKVKVMKEVV